MDFLKSAVASAMSKGPPFPYTIGERVDVEPTLWTVHNGTKREDGSPCTILCCNLDPKRPQWSQLASNAVKKLRTLRHPAILKILDVAETDTYTYLATEKVTPLGWYIKRKTLTTESIKWGLFSIAKALRFINEDAVSIHGLVRIPSVFVSESGEWKLGGFEALSSMKDDNAVMFHIKQSYLPTPPEVSNNGWDKVRNYPVTAVDAFQYGVLIYEVFGGTYSRQAGIAPKGNVPQNMYQAYRRLWNDDPQLRLSVGHFLDQGLRSGGFFDTRLIRLTEGIEKLGLQTENERQDFLGKIDGVADDLPDDFLKIKVLPELLKSIEYGGGGPRMFGLVIKLSSKLSEDEYESRITPVIVRLFASQDRAIRVCLLDNLPAMIDHLPQRLVNEKIFPQMVSGFTDVEPVVREQTVKAVLAVITKLSDRTINGELLKYLARTSNDEQPGIRTNTTICLGKIARNLGSSTRQKVLAAAFSRSLRDPFVHARNAALMALAATADVFSEEDCAMRLLPALCPVMVDKEKLVRDQANKTFDIFLQRVRKYSETLPETALRPAISSSNSASASAPAGPRMGTPQNDSSWAGWAISSFTNKISSARGEMQARGSVGNGSVAREPDTSRSISAPAIPHIESSSTTVPKYSPQPVRTSFFDGPLFARATATDANTTTDDLDEDIDAWGSLGDMDDLDGPTSSEPTPQQQTIPEPPKEKEKSSSKFVAYDESSEPDFAGWLAAQAQSKAKNKVLPKGMTKKSIPVSTGNTTGGTGTTAGSGKLGRASPGAGASKLPSSGGRPIVKSTTSAAGASSKTNKLPLSSTKRGPATGTGAGNVIDLGEAEENAWAQEASFVSASASKTTTTTVGADNNTVDTKPKDDAASKGGNAGLNDNDDDDDDDGWGHGWD
ncbi:MAG: hypothetical protein M1823_005382 [Watsoniomyces obsoletus]|nr:MAG: hypothetical protein M1823_005382 [Watsoniomyces obsoletus]